MRAPLRASTSQSPSVPKSPLPDGLSGLDVLVQAATEERERIDVKRRLSGSDSVQGGSHVRKTGSQSPTAFRHQQTLQPAPLTPPLTASSQGVEGPVGGPEAHHDLWPHGRERSLKRRRESAESSETHPAGQVYNDFEGSYSDNRVRSTERKFSATSDAYSMPAFGMDAHVPYPTAMQHQRRGSPVEESPRQSSSSTLHPVVAHGKTPIQSASPVSPMETLHVPSRHSPPRSKPKPRKPGSAALASIERELRDVELSKASKPPNAQHASTHVTKESTSQLLQPVPLRVPSRNQLLEPSASASHQTAAEEVDDFFQSTFDSPKPAPKQAPVAKEAGSSASSSHRTQLLHAPERMHKPPSSAHYAPAVSSLRNRMSSPDIQDDNSDFSFVHAAQQEDGDSVETDADLLDEIADVAGATATDDERTEYDDQDTGDMEVDIENELLSMVDDPGPQHTASHAQPAIDRDKTLPATTQVYHESSSPQSSDEDDHAPLMLKQKKPPKKLKKGKADTDVLMDGEPSSQQRSKVCTIFFQICFIL